MKPLFIVIEGIDGSGKTTIAKWLVEVFKRNGRDAVYTCEPSESLFTEALKLYKQYRSPLLDALIFACDRMLHLEAVVQPELKKGRDVICDRYYYSSIAYQGASGAPIEWVFELNRYALKPDLAIYIDVPPEVGLERIAGSLRKFPEFEERVFLTRVRAIYLDLVEKGLLEIIDGTKTIDEVKRSVLEVINKKLGLNLRIH